MKKVAWSLGCALVLLSLCTLPASSKVGPPAGMIYANDVLFKTVGTPTELPDRGQFDALYQLGDGFAAVAEAGPGDRGFNGGCWEVHEVTFVNIAPRQFTNEADLLAAAAAGDVTISDVVRRFECPLIKA
jgi:hypothetical protein